ncbi:hypothetical protein GCM10026986_24690 [Nitrincola alkalisediminis]
MTNNRLSDIKTRKRLTKFFFMTVGLILLIIIFAFTSYHSTKNQLLNNTKEKLNEATVNAIEILEEFRVDTIKKINLSRKSPNFENAIDIFFKINSESQDFDMARIDIERTMNSFGFKHYALIDNDFLIRAQNSPIFHSELINNLSEKLRSIQINNETAYIDVFRTTFSTSATENEPYLLFASHIYQDGANAILLIAINGNNVLDFKDHTFFRRINGEVLLFDREHKLINKSKYYEELVDENILSRNQESNRGLKIVIHNDSKPGNIDSYLNYYGASVLGIHTWLSELNIGLILEANLNSTLEPLVFFRDSLIKYTAIITVLLIIFLFFYKSLLQEIDKRLQYMFSIFEATSEGMLIFDLNTHQIYRTNKQVRHLFLLDTSPEKLEDIFSDIQLDGIIDKAQSSSLDDNLAPISIFYKLRNDSEIVLDVYMKSLPKRGSKRNPILITLRDITDQFTYEQEIQLARESAETSNIAKNNFLATVSHELRTPLHSIIGMIEALTSTQLTDTQKYYADMSQESADNLLEIIDNILDFTKLDSKKYIPTFSTINLVTETTSAITIASRKNKNKNSIHNNALDTFINTDKGIFKKCLLILLDNANKFTNGGSIQIFTTIADDGNKLCLEVIDTGIGIPETKLNHIFEAFGQADSAITRNYGGIGLGLSLLKGLVTQANGTIDIQSIEGEGSCFRLTIPCTLPNTTEIDEAVNTSLNTITYDFAPSAQSQEKYDKEIFSNLKVLAAEDNEINQEMLTILLSKLYINFKIFDNGQLLLDYIVSHQEQADMILMDCHMPVLDGFETTRRIRELPPPVCDIPIIAITADALFGDREKCLAQGMTDYISKPVKRNDLRQVLIRNLPDAFHSEIDFFDTSGANHENQDDFDATMADDFFGIDEEIQPQYSSFNPDALIQEVGDISIALDLFDKFNDSLDKDFTEITSLILFENYIEAKKQAHKVKGSARMMGCSALAEMLQNIEHACMDKNTNSLLDLVSKSENEIKRVKEELSIFIKVHA